MCKSIHHIRRKSGNCWTEILLNLSQRDWKNHEKGNLRGKGKDTRHEKIGKLYKDVFFFCQSCCCQDKRFLSFWESFHKGIEKNIMLDTFRRELDRRVGKGGIHCSCCNSYKGKDRKALHRIIRRTEKAKWKKALWKRDIGFCWQKKKKDYIDIWIFWMPSKILRILKKRRFFFC